MLRTPHRPRPPAVLNDKVSVNVHLAGDIHSEIIVVRISADINQQLCQVQPFIVPELGRTGRTGKFIGEINEFFPSAVLIQSL